VSLFAEAARQHARQLAIVFDDQDTQRRHRASIAAAAGMKRS
jgi:hypothetical protein